MIDEEAFEQSGLQKISIQSDSLYIGRLAFQAAQLEEVKLNAKKLTISDAAFRRCLKLKSLEVSADELTVGRFAFASCRDVQEFDVEARQIAQIDDSAFWCTPAYDEIRKAKGG